MSESMEGFSKYLAFVAKSQISADIGGNNNVQIICDSVRISGGWGGGGVGGKSPNVYRRAKCYKWGIIQLQVTPRQQEDRVQR